MKPHKENQSPKIESFQEFAKQQPVEYQHVPPRGMGKESKYQEGPPWGGDSMKIFIAINGRTSKHWEVVLLYATQKLHLGWVDEV